MGSLGIHAVFIVTAKGHVLHERIMFPGDST